MISYRFTQGGDYAFSNSITPSNDFTTESAFSNGNNDVIAVADVDGLHVSIPGVAQAQAFTGSGGYMLDYSDQTGHADFTGWNYGDILKGSESDSTLNGGGGDDTLWGGNAADVLIGGEGNDSLNGGAGEDQMTGGNGDDNYTYTSGDQIYEDANGGTDTVYVFDGGAFLADNIENLVLLGTANVGGGNDLANTITGSTNSDSISGNGGNDVIYGGESFDYLHGNDGNDTLDGGAGNDTMTGGAGDDTFIVDSDLDSASEGADQGTDTVKASINRSLTDNFENLTLLDGATIGGGNDGDNVITGNDQNNSLYGMQGDDTLIGGAGADTLSGDQGNDVYYVDNVGDIVNEYNVPGNDTVYASVDFTLSANVEDLVLTDEAVSGTGNSLNNLIEGDNQNNTINGGAGIDTMVGGAGNDFYYVDSTQDVITEHSAVPAGRLVINPGIDTVSASVSYSMAANVENLILTDTAVGGWGNADDNVITGNGMANYLSGDAGNDTLFGGAGMDSLSGSDGDDVLNGGADGDVMTGGNDNDTYYVNNIEDTVVEQADVQERGANVTSGIDSVYSSIDYLLADNVENLILTGKAVTGIGNGLDNEISGNKLANELFGYDGADVLDGGVGNDTLWGGAGDDTITGGAGQDMMGAGLGSDVLVFNTGDTAAAKAKADVVMYFDGTEGDRIDISSIDANENKNGNQDFKFIGTNDFHGKAGELRYEQIGGDTYLSGDNDGDGKADFTIHFGQKLTLQDEFILG